MRGDTRVNEIKDDCNLTKLMELVVIEMYFLSVNEWSLSL